MLRPTVLPDAEPAVKDAAAAAVSLLGTPSRLTVLVNDPQRQTRTPAVLEALRRHIEPSRTRILVATGSHSIAAAQRADFELALTAGFAAGLIDWHDSRDERLVPIGDGWRGHPWLLEDGALLAIGSVEPHYFAGFTGAHKTATVGCAAYRDIEANHAAAISPYCRPGRLETNPVYEGIVGMLSSLEALRPVATVNLVQIADRIVAAAGGAALESLRATIPLVREAYMHCLPREADALVVEVAGPLGRSFYQAEKGIKNSEWAVRDGGAIILVAPCPDGIGQDHFVALLRRAPTYSQAMAIVARQGYRLGDHKAVRLRYLTDPSCRAVGLYIVSDGISDEQAQILGLAKAASVEAALADAGVNPRKSSVYRVEDAGNMCVIAA